MKIAMAVIVCACAIVVLGQQTQTTARGDATANGMVNDDPSLEREISEATGRAEELMFEYQHCLHNASDAEELSAAREFYNREVMPAQIERLKKISRLHSFDNKGDIF